MESDPPERPVRVSDVAPKRDSSFYTKVIFLGGVASLGILSGFGSAIAMAKKRDPTSFDKGLLPGVERLESGGLLALRALGWGTVFAVGGVGLLCFGVYKVLDIQNSADFRRKMSAIMPNVRKMPQNPNERTEFGSIREFFEYIGEDKKK